MDVSLIASLKMDLAVIGVPCGLWIIDTKIITVSGNSCSGWNTWAREKLALAGWKMFLSRDALGFLVDLCFSWCGGSVARTRAIEAVAGKTGDQ
jgi:hypothetical protein